MILSPKQVKSYNEATHRFNIWVGAVSSGKTYASLDKLVERIQHGPEGDCMILGVSRESIQRNILKDLYNRMGFPVPSSKVNETKLYGRRIYFVGCNNERSVSSIQGSTLAIAYVDEAAKIPYPAWAMLTTRIRVPGAQLFATCNPEGPAHWLKKEYIDKAEEMDLINWHFTLEDNPSLDEAYIKDTKASLSGIFYRRLILGEWAAAHGAIYDTFDHFNLYDHPTSNASYYIVGIDYGTTNATAAVLLAVNPRQWPQIRVEQEYYWDSAKKGRGKTDEELVRDIVEFIGYRSVRAVYVDPAAASLKLALRHKDLPVLDAKNDVVLGIKIVSKFISGKNIAIQRGCKTLTEHLQSYAWDPKAADRGEDKPIKKDDHICLTGDTEVWSDGTICTMKEITNNDYLFTQSTLSYWNGKFIKSRFNGGKKTGKNKRIIKLILENGKTLRATPDHQVYTKRGYIEIQNLIEDDEVLCYVRKNLGVYSKVKSIEEYGFEDVYCINVPETGNFVANGIVVKNCDALRYACASAFPTGELSHPDDDMPYDKYRNKILGPDDDILGLNPGGGYF